MAYVQASHLCLHRFRATKLPNKRSYLQVGVGVGYAKQSYSSNLNMNMNEEKIERNCKLKILIAGGGIGGLVFALAAKRSGFDVRLFEKDFTAVRGEGTDRGPIQLLSSALELLESIDKNVATQIIQAGHVSCDTVLADGTTGERFMKLDYFAPAVKKGIPVTQIVCRFELQRILVNAVGEDTVMNNSKVVDFVSDAEKVTIFLENGKKHEGDILVGADGIRSIVRQKQFGPRAGEPKYSNFICYTGVAEFEPQYLPHIGVKIFVGTNQYFVSIDIGKGRMQWYAFVRWPSQTPMPSSSGNKEFVVKCFGDWCNEVRSIINVTLDKMIIPRLIHDIDVSNVWGRGRVVILGDAAHAMLPNLGQGGSMAIEDCYCLMLELQNLAEKHLISPIPLQDIELAFKTFEKKRMFRVRTLHSASRIASVMTSYYHTYLHIPPLPFFNVRLKHPAFVVSSKFLKFVLPKFMEWVVVGD